MTSSILVYCRDVPVHMVWLEANYAVHLQPLLTTYLLDTLVDILGYGGYSSDTTGVKAPSRTNLSNIRNDD